MKKHGEIRDGRLVRRGNGQGSLFKARGRYYMRFTIRDELTGKPRKVAFSTHLPDTDLDGARMMLNAKARELGFCQPNQAEILLDRAHEAQHERERIERERLERERAEAEERARREAEERAAREASERDRNAITIKSAFSYYLASKKRPDSGERTLKGYECQFETFARWTRENFPEAEKLRDFSPHMAEAFLSHLEKTRSRSTRNKFLVLLRTVWRVLRWEADAQLTVDPWDGIRTLVQTDTVRHKDLTVEELRRVVAVIRSGEPLSAPKREGSAAGGIRDVFAFDGQSIRDEVLLLFAVAVYSGLRLGDCALLTWGNVDLALGVIKVTPRKTARRYHAEITIPIHPTLGQMLARVAAATSSTGFVMPTVAEIYSRQSSMLTNRLQPIFRAAGLDTTTFAPEGGSTRARVQIGFHSIRHFFASWLDNHGTNHALTNYLTCHEQGKVEARYFHDNREALRGAILTLPTLPMLDDQQATVEAVTAAPLVVDAQSTAPAPDAPQGILEAIRAHLDGATVEELKDALAIIGKAISERSEA